MSSNPADAPDPDADVVDSPAQRTDPSALGQTTLVSTPTDADALIAAGARLRPSARQLAWQRLEITAFLHFGVNTYTGEEWGDGLEDPSIFAPERLDFDQMIPALAAAGAGLAILTVKHHDGFVLYPSRYTDHSVRSSAWRGGRGDVLREFVDACHRHGMRAGVYISPADEHEFRFGRYANGSPRTLRTIPSPPRRPASANANAAAGTDAGADEASWAPAGRFQLPATDYGAYMLDQLYEVLTGYGPIDMVWFDGASGHVPADRVEDYDVDSWCRLVRELAPQAVLDDKAPDVRWVGNENGLARADHEWSVVPTVWVGRRRGLALDETLPDVGSRDALTRAAAAGADGMSWWPAEADVSIRDGWFYHPEQAPKTPEQLLAIYHASVGRNAMLLLNVPPNPDGRFDEADVAALTRFGQLVAADLPGDLAAGQQRVHGVYGGSDAAAGAATTLALPGPVSFDRLVLAEHIDADGQQVEAAVVEVADEPLGHEAVDGAALAWRPIAELTTIGYKRILVLPEPVTASAVRVRVTGQRGPCRVELELHRSRVPVTRSDR